MTSRREKQAAKFRKHQEATEEAAKEDREAKEALQEKMSRKGGAGRLSKREIALAKRMGEGEGQRKP